ncbi:MAG TPA: DUF1266 domain-containing protein, partial [Kofleriaceae bacterium]|nr:DUF1266 domain-containing protein [Kofleriaceae bacterium]
MRPALRTSALIRLPGFLDESKSLPEIASWFRQFDGQARRSRPLIEGRRWRSVSAAEAMAARAGAELRGKQRGWVPLFVDDDDRYVCWAGDDASRLRYLDQRGGRLPSLDNLLLEALEELGWREPRDPAAPDAALGGLLEELDAAMRLYAAERDLDIGLRPGATVEARGLLAVDIGLAALPDDLDCWFSWHDGEDLDRSEETLGMHDSYLARALGIDAARTTFADLVASDDDVWNEAWLPLLSSREGERWGYVLAGEARGSIVYVADEADGGARVAWPNLASFARECLMLVRRALAHPELDVPASHSITEDQRRVLAIGGILTHVNHERHDLLGGERRGVGAVVAHAGLCGWWGVVDGDDACRQAEVLLAPHETQARAGWHGAAPDQVAFDVGRVHYVVGNAYVSTLIDAERAWSYCVRAARVAQVAYSSWRAFGEAYAACRSDTALDDDDPDESPEGRRQSATYRRTRGDAAAAVAVLLAPGGAWHGLAWATPIGDSPPPVLS